MAPERRKILYFVLILASGIFLGGTLMNLAEHYWLHAHPANEYDIREHQLVTAELRDRLHLTPEQQTQVDAILQSTVGQYQQLQNRLEPQFDGVRQASRNQLKAVLNPDQRIQFDNIVDEVDRKYPLNERPASLATPPCGQLSSVHP